MSIRHTRGDPLAGRTPRSRPTSHQPTEGENRGETRSPGNYADRSR